MGMKHATDYYDDWNFAEEMVYKYHFNYRESYFYQKRLRESETAFINLFCFPSEYCLWIPTTCKRNIRDRWPICYLDARNDMIPIHVCKEPHVALQDPKELEYVLTTHKDILQVVLPMIKDFWKDILIHYFGCFDDVDINEVFKKETWYAMKYAPDFLEKHPPTTVQPTQIFVIDGDKCVRRYIGADKGNPIIQKYVEGVALWQIKSEEQL